MNPRERRLIICVGIRKDNTVAHHGTAFAFVENTRFLSGQHFPNTKATEYPVENHNEYGTWETPPQYAMIFSSWVFF
jgi:hypothetical protein